ncbi:MAG: undecaprenyldiphospho-muramoylpentapeptide beta-N-acetylglucosaminyltransferase [Thermoanaerobaculia bacterium]|nr:undecaprenyldiphospho-muramoylpentapeptide beta-N-acetylglucosaminyltransferase [Thermoanaerobaculia bacterium]
MDDGHGEGQRVRRLLLAGGGSGGHVFPGLAVAEELLDRGWEVAWAGRRDSMEQELVSRQGMEFLALPSRPVLGRGLWSRAGALTTAAASALAARRLVRTHGIGIVLGTGGYVSVPGVLGGRLAGRPALLLEPNARAGVANRNLSRWAQGAAVAFEPALSGLRCPARLTGVPVRRDFYLLPDRPPAGPPLILVLGGSQGAEQLNRLVPRALTLLPPGLPRLEVIHQAGERHLEETKREYAKCSTAGSGLEIEVTDFLPDVAVSMGRASLVISRAGAVTLAEICAARRPAVLVPLRIAGGHQIDNARGAEASGGARVLSGDDATAERLAAILGSLLAAPGALPGMGASLGRLARRNAAGEIADWVERLEEAA